jgi:hypothetical protein
MSVRGSEQAVVTDFDEAFGQDVLKEAADKLLGGNGRESGLISGRILVGKSHLAILEGEDPAIADGDAKDVRSEVFEGGGASAYRLRVNDPIFAPDLLIKEMEEIALFEQVPELGAEEDRERLDVNEEILPGLEPPAIGEESASGGDVVNVRMIEEIARPGMEDADGADLPSDEARIGSQFEQGFR